MRNKQHFQKNLFVLLKTELAISILLLISLPRSQFSVIQVLRFVRRHFFNYCFINHQIFFYILSFLLLYKFGFLTMKNWPFLLLFIHNNIDFQGPLSFCFPLVPQTVSLTIGQRFWFVFNFNSFRSLCLLHLVIDKVLGLSCPH